MTLGRARPVVALALVGVLAGCSGGPVRDDPITGQSAEPTATAPPAPSAAPTPVTPPATPSAYATAAPPGSVAYRDYLGAEVPGAAAGPTRITATSASGWRRDQAGAVLAAAHLAVALDARQPRALWRPAVDAAVPRRAVAAARARTERQAASWDSRLSADERARRAKPSDTDAGLGPRSVWSPPVRVVGYSRLRTGPRRTQVTVWARSDGTSRWFSRTLDVRWVRGDWRLRLPEPAGWREEPPAADIRPISELST